MNGTQYAVNICKQTARTGDIVQLVGASQPFSTQEDDSDDIFSPIRTQTGYLRVIDTDGTLLANLIPANNTEYLVQLWSGTNSGGTFTPHALCWQGFLQAQAYTQPWDNNASVLELPVKSLLGALEDVSIDETFASTEKNVAALILAAFDNFGLRADSDLTHLVITADVSDAPNTLLKPFIQMSVFFDKETVNNEGDSYEQMVGMSYYDALSAVMSLYGLQLREDGTRIYMSQFDGTNLKTWSVGWGIQLRGLANGSTVVIDSYDLPSVDMLTALTFKGADNIAGYSQGGRSAKVTLSFEKIDENIFNLLHTTEDTSEVISVSCLNGNFRGQPHEPRINDVEEYSFYSYTQIHGDPPVPSNYAACLRLSALRLTPASSPQAYVGGAFPIRWSFRPTDDSRAHVLVNGLLLNTIGAYPDGTINEKAMPAYKIKTRFNKTFYGGFLNLHLGIDCFLDYRYVEGLMHWFYDSYNSVNKHDCTFFVKLSWGDYYWNGEEWTTVDSTFSIKTDGKNIISNKDDYALLTDASDGFIIPVDGQKSGIIQLTLMNCAGASATKPDGTSSEAPVITSIISNMSLDYIPSVSITESSRTNNTYRQNIMASGFNEEKQIDLTLGTINNNVESLSFIKQNLTTYIEKFPYIDASATINQRPELHLLGRMVEQYGQVRRMFEATVRRGTELMRTAYTYQLRRFFGVKKLTDWRDDTEDVKFIEV